MSEHNQYPLQTVLELACAAYRQNKDYVKFTVTKYTDEGNFNGYIWANKQLMTCTLDPGQFAQMKEDKPPLLCTNLEDRELANDIQKFFRRLMFNAVAGDNDFYTEVNALLNSTTVPMNKLGFIACLPTTYRREVAKRTVEKTMDTLDNGYLGTIGSSFEDKDCEVIESRRSKNYDAWNILAIIDNKLASWMSKTDLRPGPCVVIRARVKDLGKHWKNQQDETRLNYVKAAQ